MTASLHDTRVAIAVSLKTSVEAEQIRRLRQSPDTEFYAGRDDHKLANEFCLLADLQRALNRLEGINRESSQVRIEGAVDFARGVLRDCGVER